MVFPYGGRGGAGRAVIDDPEHLAAFLVHDGDEVLNGHTQAGNPSHPVRASGSAHPPSALFFGIEVGIGTHAAPHLGHVRDSPSLEGGNHVRVLFEVGQGVAVHRCPHVLTVGDFAKLEDGAVGHVHHGLVARVGLGQMDPGLPAERLTRPPSQNLGLGRLVQAGIEELGILLDTVVGAKGLVECPVLCGGELVERVRGFLRKGGKGQDQEQQKG